MKIHMIQSPCQDITKWLCSLSAPSTNNSLNLKTDFGSENDLFPFQRTVNYD